MSVHQSAPQPPDPNQNIEQLRPEVTKLVTDMTVDQSLSEEFLIDKLLALISKQVTEARKDELNRAAFTIVSILANNIDDELDMSDIQETFETYQKLRAIELKQTPPTPNGDSEVNND